MLLVIDAFQSAICTARWVQCSAESTVVFEWRNLILPPALLYQYFATVPVLVFLNFRQVKSVSVHIFILFELRQPKIHETEAEEEVEDMFD